MARDRFPPSIIPPEELESDEEEEEEIEEEEEEEEQVEADAGKEAEGEYEVEEDESEKTTSQVRGLDYGSDGDSGKTFPSPSASAFVVKQNSKPELKPKKRPAEIGPPKEMSEVKKAKKEKKRSGAVAEDKAKRSSGGQRIWGPEDELMILTGMLDYKEKMGVDHNSNFDAFHKYIKSSLNAVVDKSQLINKIRKLKEKYRINAQREASSEALVFLKDHEAEAYEHSKKLWGGKSVTRGPQLTKSRPKNKAEVNVVSNAPILELDNVLALPVPKLDASTKEVIRGGAKAARRVRTVVRKMDLDEAIVEKKNSTISMPAMVNNFMIENGLELVEKSKVDALNEKWTEYQLEAAQLYLKRLDLVTEHTKFILEALKGNR